MSKISACCLFFLLPFFGMGQGLTFKSSKTLPFITVDGHQVAAVILVNNGDSVVVTVRIWGMADQMIGIGSGERTVEVRVPAVTRDSVVEVGFVKGGVAGGAGGAGTVVATDKVSVAPAKKMTIYILPHSHNDIGYTEIQTNVEKKQMNNLLTGIEYARRTKDYPAGARFVWNLEGLYAADLFLHRMDEQQKKDFLDAVKDGRVALNGMYLNTLTGLCRPEELLQLFHYSTTLAQQVGVKVDAAMISDVPGYTWGTVAAMAQAGIKYFSAAPNNFDRIGDILDQWEDKPFYWVSPSGKEKVLVWIPYKGYSLSHGMPQGLTKDFVVKYMDVLKGKGFPYDISYIRWSGHGDNAVPDMTICDFVKDWSSRYAWPRFVISSTSDAFGALEARYGDQLPREQGDWTGYWEDGAASSAYETAENRASSSRLSQAEVLWAMKSPSPKALATGGAAKYPVDSFAAAWQHVILYSEHTWGADESVTRPLSQKTKEQWEIKKSYATEADSLSRELMKGAFAGEGMAAGAIDVYNTNSWERTGLILTAGQGNGIKDDAGHRVASQRLSTGELAFVAEKVPPFAARRYYVVKAGGKGGPVKDIRSVEVGKNWLDNGIVRVVVNERTGAIKSLRARAIDNDFVDSASGDELNDYLYLQGNKLADLQRNGPVRISVKERGPVESVLQIVSEAPGCNSLTREVRLVRGMDYVELTDILDKKPATLDPSGDYQWANKEGKESVNIGFPFHVTGGAMQLDIPLALMRPEQDQLPGSCKNWLEVGNYADVSNATTGITWVTLDAPLVEVGGITATLLGGQSHPEVWRKHIEPTQKLYSWAINNHWETNYRAYQDGIITFRYALRPHGAFDALSATEFSTGLVQPLIVGVASMGRAVGLRDTVPMLRLTGGVGQAGSGVIVVALRPSEDGKAFVVTLYNPGESSVTATLGTQAVEVAGRDVITVRVER